MFALCEKAGLKVFSKFSLIDSINAEELKFVEVISAREVEKMLSEAPTMKIQHFGKVIKEIPSGWTGCENPSGNKMTHTARLVMIEEIKREQKKVELTREQLWKELSGKIGNATFQDIAERLGL